MLQVLLQYLRPFLKIIKERKILLFAGCYILGLWIFAALFFHRFEQTTSLFDAFYWAVTTTTTVGYGDIVAQTPGGKIISIIVMLSGISVLGLVLVTLTDLLVEQTFKKRRRIKSYMKNHVIICGWNKKLEIAVKELLSANQEIVVIAEVDDIPLEHTNLLFIKGDPSDDENLKRANVEKASFALISGQSDTETLLSAIAVEKLNSLIHITCIVSDPKVIQALKRTGVEQTLSADEFLGLVLSRSIFVPQISSFLNEIMDIKGMDLHQEKIPDEIEGKPFFEVLKMLKEQNDIIPIGIVRGSAVTINPEKGMKLQKDDEILYIAEEKLDLASSSRA